MNPCLYFSVQFSSVAQSCLTLCNPMDCSTPGFPIYHQLPELAQTHVHWVSDAIQPSHPLSSPFSLIFSIRVFSNESALYIRWPKYWSFSFNISPSNEHSGLISFRTDLLDLLAVQGTLKSSPTPQFKSISFQHSAFFMVQLSHPYMTTGKTIALTRCTFVGKVMSLLFNMLSRLVITFLPRSKHLLISWLQSPSAVILEPPKNKVSHCFHCFCIYLPWSDGTGCHDLRFLKVEFWARFFPLLFDFHQEVLQFLFTFCHKGGIICVSEVIDISPGSLVSSLCFILPSILHDVLCI